MNAEPMNAQSSIRGVSFAAILLFVACGSSESTGVLFPVDGGAGEDSADDIGEDVASVDAPGDTAGSTCVEDRFGARTEQNPVPLPVDETLDDLALCDGGADWFAVDGLAGEGWTVDVLGDPERFRRRGPTKTARRPSLAPTQGTAGSGARPRTSAASSASARASRSASRTPSRLV